MKLFERHFHTNQLFDDLRAGRISRLNFTLSVGEWISKLYVGPGSMSFKCLNNCILHTTDPVNLHLKKSHFTKSPSPHQTPRGRRRGPTGVSGARKGSLATVGARRAPTNSILPGPHFVRGREVCYKAADDRFFRSFLSFPLFARFSIG